MLRRTGPASRDQPNEAYAGGWISRCGIVAPMKKTLTTWLLAGPLALLLASGAAQAQLKAPATSKSDAPLGSGIYVPSESPASAPAATSAVPLTEDVRPLDAVVQDIADCMLETLPADWVVARVEVTELSRGGKAREFEAVYVYVGPDGKDKLFTPCDLRTPAVNIYQLNRALEPAKRQWKKASLFIYREGKFDLKYDYDKSEPEKAADKPAAKPVAKPAGKAAKTK